MTTIVADLETDNLLDDVTRIWCIGCYFEEERRYEEFNDQNNGCRSIREGLEELRKADTVVFHNGLNYDVHVIAKLYPALALDPKKVRDTLVMSRLENPSRRSHRLDDLGQELWKFPKHDFHDFSKYSVEMSDYMRQDIRIGVLLWRHFSKLLADWGQSVEIEHRFAYLISLQMLNGFTLDVPAAITLLTELRAELAVREKELMDAFPPILVAGGEFTPKRDDAKKGYVAGCPLTKVKLQEFNSASRQQIAERLSRKYGWVPTVFTESGVPEVSEETLKGLDYPEAKIASEFLRIKKMADMLDAPIKPNGSGGGWLRHEKKGRVYGYVNSNGAVTGRCTHSKPNVAQADSDHRMRALWIPRVGWVLVGSDAEGIELRGLGHYLRPWDGGEFADRVAHGDKSKSTDVHSVNRDILGLFNRGGGGKIGAKNYIYALIYGAGDAKLGALIVQDAIDAGKYNTDDAPWLFEKTKTGKVKPRSKTALGKESRAKIEKGIKGLGELTRAVKARARTKGFLIGIDGRKLWVRSEHSALNTLLQGFGAVVMKVALIEFHDLNEADYGTRFAYCANVHDEVQIESDPAIAERIGRCFVDCIVSAGVHLNSRCELAGTFVIGKNWSETH